MQAISTILDNPRYTGYEFWHPYSVRRHPGLPPEAYRILVRSDRPVHPALVAIDDFLAVATMRSRPTRPRHSRTSKAQPVLLHRINCAICGRTMSLSSRTGRVRYRCRPTTTDQAASHQLSIYLAESRVLAALERWLRQESETCPSWAHRRPALNAMIDAVNLRITYDPGTDSIHVTTDVGREAAMELRRR